MLRIFNQINIIIVIVIVKVQAEAYTYAGDVEVEDFLKVHGQTRDEDE